MTYYRRPPPWFYSGQEPPTLYEPPKFDPPIDEGRLLKEYAEWLRSKRKKRPEIEQALIAVRGHNNPDEHPYAVAARILPKVNAWLEKRGYKPVLRKALAARIAHS